MEKLTKSELINILMDVNSSTFIGLTSLTDVQMDKYLDYWLVDETTGKKKKNPNPIANPFFDAGIKCLAKKYKIITGFDYESSVNNRLEKEGKESNFESSGNWFENLSKGLVIDKKTQSKFYLRYQYLADSITDIEYLQDGNSIDKKMFEAYLKAKTDYKNQGLDNTLKFQVCNIDNILNISINGKQYEIV